MARKALWPELALAAFIAVNALAMLVSDYGQTVPFHFIWISLTLVYGYRAWRATWTVAALVAVCILTSVILLAAVARDGLDSAELTEVPLMAAVFLANIMHARRREAALAQARRLAAEQERQRENERNFLRDASHLLRTPLTIARGYTELMRSRLVDEDLRQDTDVILRELDSVTRISSRLLLLSVTELDQLMVREVTDVGDLIAQAELRWRPSALRSWEVSAERCELYGDPGMLESALDALIENAIRHTAERDRISLRCRRHRGDVVISVVDDGDGIPDELLPTLFERKWRPRSPDERTGSGLGLAIVKAIVGAHGGDVRAGNAGHGGAEFTLRLPGLPSPGLPLPEEPRATVAAPAPARPRRPLEDAASPDAVR